MVISNDDQFDTQDSFYPIENGKVTLNTSHFNSDSYFTFAITANPLTTPEVTLTGDELTWGAVEHADQYEVTINLENGTKRTVPVEGTSLNLSLLEPSLASGSYTVTVTAKTNNPAYADSEPSAPKPYVVVDKTNLKAKTDEINGKIQTGELDKEEYTPASWTALDEAMNEAQRVLDDPAASQAQVDKALEDLTNARNALTKLTPDPGVDKTGLQNKYDGIREENLEEEEYTPASWTALEEAMNEAQRVLDDPAASQAQVDKALEDLTTARNALTKLTPDPGVDKTGLQNKFNDIRGENLEEEEYTPASWSALEEAMNEAQRVLDDPAASQTQVDKALEDLTTARNALTKLTPDPAVDKTGLQNKFNDIQEENLEEEEYTLASWSALEEAMNEAQRVLDDPAASQTQVDKALEDLTTARTGLTLVNGEENTAVLQTLVPSTGSLSPAFDPAKDSYSITVPNSVYQLQLTPTALDPHAKIEISVGNGEWSEVSSGVVSGNLPLQVGSNTIVVKVTDPLGHVMKYTINATRMPASDSNNGGGSGNNGGGNSGGNSGSTPVSTPPASTPAPTPTPAAPKDNLETTRDGSHQPFAVSKSSDSKQTVVEVDPAKLLAAMSQGTGQQFAIHSPNEGDVNVGGLTLEVLNQLTNQGSKLNISNPLAIYPVPGSKMDMKAVSSQLGSAAMNDIAVLVDITRSSDALISSAKNKAAADGYELLVNPVDLDLTFTKDGQTVRTGQLNGYAPKYIALPEGIDPNRITTGVIINPDGSIYHVPTVVTKIDSRYYALINDLRSSGSYSVIWNPQDFDDVRTHWGKEDVNNIAARLDLKGNGDNTFAPNRQVTRSEFAELVVLSLGLMRQDAPHNKFPDIHETTWFRSSVALANEWGIVKGYNDGNFYGSQQMTREQGFAMIARAYRLVNPEAVVSGEQINTELARYNDSTAVSAWAQADIAQLIQAGIIQGSGKETFRPQASMTRAEVAALLARMLKVTDLIDK
ncbi:S-layer homology domain-containing protein [Paenibacillus sp. AN1007]|uniref:S-layer homology domain-containing protein n=1 Tax=Paenibacillus sp. AN1007 TaxID=3151385 RepID=A0AAU8NDS7_9BACL